MPTRSINSVSELNQGTLQVYPNPTDESFRISNNEIISGVLYNQLGATVKRIVLVNEVDVSDLPAGVYFLKINNSRGINLARKIIIY